MKHLIILIGLPGSGKSTFCKEFLPSYFRVSQDDMGRKEHRQIYLEALNKYDHIVVDRCNFDREQRNRYTWPARKAGYKITMMMFTTNIHECVGRISKRHKHPNLNSNTPTYKIYKIVETFARLMKEPTKDEYDELVHI